MRYRDVSTRISSAALIATIDRLQRRIAERFPGSGLGDVCRDLLNLAQNAESRADGLQRPMRWFRGAVAVSILAGLGALLWLGISMSRPRVEDELSNVLQGFEAAVNLGTFAVVGTFFALNLAPRWRRHRVMAALHDVRGIMHVIDMHQLAKDPTRALTDTTASSPLRDLKPAELARYLAYASEMLSLSAKIAVIYGQHVNDTFVAEAVNDLERTAASLSTHLWQKIAVAQRMHAR